MKRHLLLGLALGAAGSFPARAAELVRPVTNQPPALTVTNAAPAPDAAALFQSQDRFTYSIDEDPARGVEADIVVVNALNELHCRVSRASDLTVAVDTKGRTIEQVRKEIKTKLDAEYYQNATVRLEWRERAVRPAGRSGKVLFLGEGTKGGTLVLAPDEELKLFEAVHQVGVTEFANLKKVKLTRVVDKATGKTETKEYNLEEMKKDRSKNVILQDGDIIEVRDNWINFK